MGDNEIASAYHCTLGVLLTILNYLFKEFVDAGKIFVVWNLRDTQIEISINKLLNNKF